MNGFENASTQILRLEGNTEGVKALIFDVDGTVYDWKNTAKARIETLARENDQVVDRDRFTQPGVGNVENSYIG